MTEQRNRTNLSTPDSDSPVNDTKLDRSMISSFRVILGAYITPKSKLAQEINENDCKWSFTLF